MKPFSPKPYKLHNTIQNYPWGTRNGSAFIPQFLGTVPEPDVPYAELWIGAHPKAPSQIEIDGQKTPLDVLIEKYPSESVGAYVCERFGRTLPFLLKVLSAANALSIQTHPNKQQAQRLHAQDPKNYPDDNHKPEIAVALDALVALAGFKPISAIRANIAMLPELKELVGPGPIDAVSTNSDPVSAERAVKALYETVMQHAEDSAGLAVCIANIQKRLAAKSARSPEEEQFIEQHRIFGSDVGLLSFFFFNLVRLEPGQAIFTDAGVPHAYIKGNICECMANSDNVVRAGLTNKFKDVATLIDIVKYEFAPCSVMHAPEYGKMTYPTSAKEFEVSLFREPKGFRMHGESRDRPGVFLVTKGALDVRWTMDSGDESIRFVAGESVFMPASFSRYEISSEKAAEFFAVAIP